VNRMAKRHLSFMPIPALIVIIAALYLIVKPSVFYEPPWLLPITNTVFVTVVFFIVAYIAMRNYTATGRIQFLLLGCGVLAFGIGGVVAGFVRSVPGAGANLNVTIYNTGALIGAVFHFAAAFILLAGISPEVGSERKEFWLVLSYVGLIIFIGLFTMGSLRGIIPPFFVQGVGPTALRQWVLGSADLLFAFSFLIFMGSYLKNREVFLYWYSLALALTSISLTAFFIESAVGSPIGWAGRFSQYLGGIYFLVAVIKAIRSAQVRRRSLDDILTASLSPAEEKFRALAEHSPDMIERFDREAKHLYVNQAALRLYGKPAGSIIGNTIEEMRLPGPHVSLLKERIQRVFETAQPTEVEHYIPTENGKRFYHSRCVPEFGVDGTVVNVLVVSSDLTEKKEAEEALRQSHERAAWLARFPEENPSPVLRVSAKGAVLYCNPASAELPGWACVVGQPLPDALLPFVRPALMEGQEVQQDVQLAEKFYFVSITPFPGERYANVYGHDITDRKRAEEALKKAHEDLQDHATRLEAANKELESFSYSVSHDLRSPLRAIAGFTRMILDDHGTTFDPETRRKFGVIQENAEKMGQLIDNLLRLSCLGRAELHRSKLDIGGLVHEVIQEIRMAEPEREWVTEIGDLPAAHGDRLMVRQLLANLLSNAVKFTRGKQGARIEVGSFERSGERVYYVKDNGVGFDMKYYNKLFGVFQRLVSESQFEGTGVGLSIVQRIVQRHGGRVWAEGQMQGGATFYFTLPPKEEG
jgi:PAS domain S-box-containing protein